MEMAVTVIQKQNIFYLYTTVQLLQLLQFHCRTCKQLLTEACAVSALLAINNNYHKTDVPV